MDESTRHTLEMVDRTLELSEKQMEFVGQIDDYIDRFFETIDNSSVEKALKTTPKKFTKRLAL